MISRLCKHILSARLKWVQRCYTHPALYGQPSSSTYRWPEEATRCDVTIISVYGLPKMLSRLGNVLVTHASKHWSCPLIGTACLRTAVHSAPAAGLPPRSLSSPAVSGQKYHKQDSVNCKTSVHFCVAAGISANDTQRSYGKRLQRCSVFPRTMSHPHLFLGAPDPH